VSTTEGGLRTNVNIVTALPCKKPRPTRGVDFHRCWVKNRKEMDSVQNLLVSIVKDISENWKYYVAPPVFYVIWCEVVPKKWKKRLKDYSKSPVLNFFNSPLNRSYPFIANLGLASGSMFRFFFKIISDDKLERKRWFRVLRVINIVLYFLVFLTTFLVGMFFFDKRSDIARATVRCEDGTRWNAVGEDGRLLYNYELCGLCTKRSKVGKTYEECTIRDYRADSFEVVNKQYKVGKIIKVPLMFLVVVLSLLKLLMRAVVYVTVGRR